MPFRQTTAGYFEENVEVKLHKGIVSAKTHLSSRLWNINHFIFILFFSVHCVAYFIKYWIQGMNTNANERFPRLFLFWIDRKREFVNMGNWVFVCVCARVKVESIIPVRRIVVRNQWTLYAELTRRLWKTYTCSSITSFTLCWIH